MRLSTKGRYAIMAMADLAANGANGALPLPQVAERQDISLSYLEQLFVKLRRGGLVVGARGPGGGYRLARAAEDIAVIDIMRAVDEPIKTTRCDIGSPIGCTGVSGKCLTHKLWDGLARQIEGYLEAVRLSDLVKPGPLAFTAEFDALAQRRAS